MAMNSGNRAKWAFLGSFSVYLLPVYSVHASIPLGAMLWAALFSGFDDHDAVWITVILGLAVFLQCIAGALIYWLLRALRWFRMLALIAGSVAIFAAIQFGYLLAIPWALLTEGEQSAELGNWPVACTITEAEVIEGRTVSADLQRAGQAWLLASGSRYVLLEMPGCITRELAVTPHRTTIDQMIPQGRALYRVSEQGGGADSHFVLAEDGTVQSLDRPADLSSWRPVLAGDGSAIAWIESKRISGGIGTRWSIRVQELPDMQERTFDLQLDRPASIELIAFGSEAGVFLAIRNGNEYVAIDNSGLVSPEANAPEAKTQPTQRIVRVDRGWVSWDVYRDKGRHRIAWSLPAGNGSHEVPLGRGIRFVTASPDGQLIAVSVGSNVRVGSIKESVYVLRAADGQEVYRRFFAPYHRSLPAFIGNDYLAVTIRENDLSRVDLLSIPSDVR